MEPTATTAPETKPIITPTIGRQVWFWPNGNTFGVPGASQPEAFMSDQAMAATIVCVWSDRMVNLQVLDHGGAPHMLRSIRLKQAGDEDSSQAYCEWMPYQAGQAKRIDQAEGIALMAQFKAAIDELSGELKTMNEGIDEMRMEFARLQPEGKKIAAVECKTTSVPVAQGSAPRVTLQDIEASITDCCYFTASDGFNGANFLPGIEPPAALRMLTLCVLTLDNGFTVLGESACASPENFDSDVGRRIARADAVRKVWPLLGFALKTRLKP